MESFWVIICILIPILSFMVGFFIQLAIPKKAADKFFPLSKFEGNGKWYERIGVKAFKNVLIHTGYNAIMQKEMKLREHVNLPNLID